MKWPTPADAYFIQNRLGKLAVESAARPDYGNYGQRWILIPKDLCRAIGKIDRSKSSCPNRFHVPLDFFLKSRSGALALCHFSSPPSGYKLYRVLILN